MKKQECLGGKIFTRQNYKQFQLFSFNILNNLKMLEQNWNRQMTTSYEQVPLETIHALKITAYPSIVVIMEQRNLYSAGNCKTISYLAFISRKLQNLHFLSWSGKCKKKPKVIPEFNLWKPLNLQLLWIKNPNRSETSSMTATIGQGLIA